MKRLLLPLAMLVAAALVAPVIRADVKTTEKTSFNMEGILGAMMNRLSGNKPEGTTSTVTVKGNRMARMNADTGIGSIVDLTEEKIYNVDTKKKEYTVMTFAEMRAQMEKLRADMAKQQAPMKPEDKQAMQDLAKQFEFDVEVKESGQAKAIAGHNARETVLTISMRAAGKTLDESGGMVLTNNLWLAPRVPALDEVGDFGIRFIKAAFGGAFTGMDQQQMTALSSMLPGVTSLWERMAAETRKLQGTVLASTSLLESVKSAEQMAAATASQASGSGTGLGGAIANRFMRGRGGATQKRTTTLTTTREVLSIGSSASADDVAIPAGFKQK